MQERTKKKIEIYIKHQILFSGTLSEIKDLLLYLELIRFEAYRKLAGFVKDIHKIKGLNRMAWGVYNLDHNIRHQKKIFSCIGYYKNTINFKDSESLEYFLEKLEIEINAQLRQLEEIFNSKLISAHPTLLSSLLNQLQKAQDLNGSLLGKETVKKIITLYFKNNHIRSTQELIDELVCEFNPKNQKRFKQIFVLDHSEKEIINQRQFFILCTQSKHVRQRISNVKNSRYITKGVSAHLATGDYATIIAGIISVVMGIVVSIILQLISMILQWTSLLIPISTLLPFISPLGSAISIITLVVTIYLQNYLNSRRERYETELKRDLIFSLSRDVPEYASLLAKSGYDLRGLGNQRFYKEVPDEERQECSNVPVPVPEKLLDELLSPPYRTHAFPL